MTTHNSTDSLPVIRKDSLPEHKDYTDDGCNISPSCLRCPLARCKYDVPDITRVNSEISNLHNSGWSVERLREEYGMTERTVYRRIHMHASGADQLSNNHRRLQDKPGISLEALAKRSSYKAPLALGGDVPVRVVVHWWC